MSLLFYHILNKLFFLIFELLHYIIDIVLINWLLFLKLFIWGYIQENIFTFEVVANTLHYKRVLSENTGTAHFHIVKFIFVRFLNSFHHQLLFKVEIISYCFSVYFIYIFFLLFITCILDSCLSLLFICFWFLLNLFITKHILIFRLILLNGFVSARLIRGANSMKRTKTNSMKTRRMILGIQFSISVNLINLFRGSFVYLLFWIVFVIVFLSQNCLHLLFNLIYLSLLF